MRSTSTRYVVTFSFGLLLSLGTLGCGAPAADDADLSDIGGDGKDDGLSAWPQFIDTYDAQDLLGGGAVSSANPSVMNYLSMGADGRFFMKVRKIDDAHPNPNGYVMDYDGTFAISGNKLVFSYATELLDPTVDPPPGPLLGTHPVSYAPSAFAAVVSRRSKDCDSGKQAYWKLDLTPMAYDHTFTVVQHLEHEPFACHASTGSPCHNCGGEDPSPGGSSSF